MKVLGVVVVLIIVIVMYRLANYWIKRYRDKNDQLIVNRIYDSIKRNTLIELDLEIGNFSDKGLTNFIIEITTPDAADDHDWTSLLQKLNAERIKRNL